MNIFTRMIGTVIIVFVYYVIIPLAKRPAEPNPFLQAFMGVLYVLMGICLLLFFFV